jgi:hypothetical protein
MSLELLGWEECRALLEKRQGGKVEVEVVLEPRPFGNIISVKDGVSTIHCVVPGVNLLVAPSEEAAERAWRHAYAAVFDHLPYADPLVLTAAQIKVALVRQGVASQQRFDRAGSIEHCHWIVDQVLAGGGDKSPLIREGVMAENREWAAGQVLGINVNYAWALATVYLNAQAIAYIDPPLFGGKQRKV